MRVFLRLSAVATALGIVAAAGPAATQSLGEFEYMNSCVPCHGASGTGDGPVSDFLSGAVVPDLTVLQSDNGGVFPVTRVYAVIEGSQIAGAHGTRDMPIWGSRYRMRLSRGDDAGLWTPEQSDAYVQARILALIEYLSSIQVQ